MCRTRAIAFANLMPCEAVAPPEDRSQHHYARKNRPCRVLQCGVISYVFVCNNQEMIPYSTSVPSALTTTFEISHLRASKHSARLYATPAAGLDRQTVEIITVQRLRRQLLMPVSNGPRYAIFHHQDRPAIGGTRTGEEAREHFELLADAFKQDCAKTLAEGLKTDVTTKFAVFYRQTKRRTGGAWNFRRPSSSWCGDTAGLFDWPTHIRLQSQQGNLTRILVEIYLRERKLVKASSPSAGTPSCARLFTPTTLNRG